MPKLTKEFDKVAYDKAFHKENYKQLAGVFTKAEAAEVEAAAKAAGLTNSMFIKQAVFEKIERESE